MNFKHREIKLKRKKNIIEPHTHTKTGQSTELLETKRNDYFCSSQLPAFQLSVSMRTNAIVNGGGPLRRGMMVMGRIASILPTRRNKSAIAVQRLELGWIWFHNGKFHRPRGENVPGDCR